MTELCQSTCPGQKKNQENCVLVLMRGHLAQEAVWLRVLFERWCGRKDTECVGRRNGESLVLKLLAHHPRG